MSRARTTIRRLRWRLRYHRPRLTSPFRREPSAPLTDEPVFTLTVEAVEEVAWSLVDVDHGDGTLFFLADRPGPIARLRWGSGLDTRVGSASGELWYGWHLHADRFSKVINVEYIEDDLVALCSQGAGTQLADERVRELRDRSRATARDQAFRDLAEAIAAGKMTLKPLRSLNDRPPCRMHSRAGGRRLEGAVVPNTGFPSSACRHLGHDEAMAGIERVVEEQAELAVLEAKARRDPLGLDGFEHDDELRLMYLRDMYPAPAAFPRSGVEPFAGRPGSGSARRL